MILYSHLLFWPSDIRPICSLWINGTPLFAVFESTRFRIQFGKLLVNWFHNHRRVCMFPCSNQRWFQKSGVGEGEGSGHFSWVWGQAILSSLISFHLCPCAQERPFEVTIGILTRPYEERKWEMRFVATLTPTNADVTDRCDKLPSCLCELSSVFDGFSHSIRHAHNWWGHKTHISLF